MAFINRWVLTAWAKPWVPFRLSREHDGSSGSQVPSHRRFNVGVIVVHGATAAIKGHGNKLIKMSLPIYIQPGSRGVFLIRDFLSPSNQTTLSFKRSIRPALCRTCKAPDRTCFSRYTWTWSRTQTTRSFQWKNLKDKSSALTGRVFEFLDDCKHKSNIDIKQSIKRYWKKNGEVFRL